MKSLQPATPEKLAEVLAEKNSPEVQEQGPEPTEKLKDVNKFVLNYGARSTVLKSGRTLLAIPQGKVEVIFADTEEELEHMNGLVSCGSARKI